MDKILLSYWKLVRLLKGWLLLITCIKQKNFKPLSWFLSFVSFPLYSFAKGQLEIEPFPQMFFFGVLMGEKNKKKINLWLKKICSAVTILQSCGFVLEERRKLSIYFVEIYFFNKKNQFLTFELNCFVKHTLHIFFTLCRYLTEVIQVVTESPIKSLFCQHLWKSVFDQLPDLDLCNSSSVE